MLAQNCLLMKDYPCSIDTFHRILQQSPDSVAIHMLLGEAFDGSDRRLDAISEFQMAARVAPREPNVHFGLGFLYWNANRLDEAKKEFENELVNDSAHAQSIAYLGDVEMKGESPEK